MILVEGDEIDREGRSRITGPRALHLLEVLRVRAGQKVRIGVIDGPRGVGLVRSIAGPEVELECILETTAPERPRVDLLLALPRPKVLRRLWAQLSALGIGRLILTNAEKVERPYFDTHVLRSDVYRALLIEGLQQAGDTRLPEVSIHRRLKVLIEDELDTWSDAGLRLVADPAAAAPVGEVVRTRLDPDPQARVLVAVGPEGGWNSFELDLLRAHHFHPVGLGSRTLRTDTACLALLALVHDAVSRHGGAPEETVSRRP